MKSRHFRCKTHLLLLGLVVSLGCRDEAQVTSQEAKTTNPSASALAPTNATAATNEIDPLVTARKIEPAITNKLSPAVAEIVKLAQGGVTEDVLLAYIERAPATYNLAVEEILYLYDLGLPVPVISALIRRGNAFRDEGGAQQDRAEASVAGLTPVPAAPIHAVEPPQYAPQQPVQTQETVVTPAPVYAEPAPVYAGAVATSVPYFYDDLAPYGAWVDLPNYGWCWQPYAATLTTGWRPYFNRGRWLSSDYSWYWQSDYSWGWAPFHYGRWHNYPSRGWFWVPDNVWGPSWVSFRHSDLYYGWAPLPPGAHWRAGFGFSFNGGSVGIGFDFGLSDYHYAFVPHGRFCDPHVQNYFVGNTHIKNVHKKSKVVNNYFVGPNNTVINKGIAREEVAKVSRTEVPKVAVREAPARAGMAVKADRIERDGNTLVVYKPQLQKSLPPMASIKGGQPDVARATPTASPEGSLVPRMEQGRPSGDAASRSEVRSVETRPGMEPVRSKSGQLVPEGLASGTIKPLENRRTSIVDQDTRERQTIETPARATVPVFPQFQGDRANRTRPVEPRSEVAKAAPALPPDVATPSSARDQLETRSKSLHLNNRPIERSKRLEAPRTLEAPTTRSSPVYTQPVNPNVYSPRPQVQAPRQQQAPSRQDYNPNSSGRTRDEGFRNQQVYPKSRSFDSPSPQSPAVKPVVPQQSPRVIHSQPAPVRSQPFRPPPTVAQPSPRYQAPSMQSPRQPSAPPPVSIQPKSAEMSRPHNPVSERAPVRSAPPPPSSSSRSDRNDSDGRRNR